MDLNSDLESHGLEQEDVQCINIIYDSTDVHFDFSIFLQQLFIHLAFPVSIFFSPNPAAQSFLDTRFMVNTFNFANIFNALLFL